MLLEKLIDGCTAVVLLCNVKVLAALVAPWATEPNAREAGVMVMGVTPVPVRVAVWVVPTPLGVTERLPVCAPTTVGLKVTLIVQVEFAATEVQVVVSAKGAAVEIVSGTAAVV